MKNLPVVHMGIVASSRGNFPRELAEKRRDLLAQACGGWKEEVYVCLRLLIGEEDVGPVLESLRQAGVNALTVYLGNFGPEIPESMLAQRFDGPVMFVAAAEERADGLFASRGDAYCGLLNAVYNAGIRGTKVYLPARPVGNVSSAAACVKDFLPVARCILGLRKLKVITFGPRPNDFVACNAPEEPLFRLGIEIEQNSELDLYQAFLQHEGDSRIKTVAGEMERELGGRCDCAGALTRLAQYEITLQDWMEQHKGDSEYVVFANRCWPAFEPMFGFVPCYDNGRLTAQGIPVSCEVDVYGAISEYLGMCASESSVTILDLNNTVPEDLFEAEIQGRMPARQEDLFMGFHCGNAPVCRMKNPKLESHKILGKNLPEGALPSITEGTLEGELVPGDITVFRLQSTARGELRAYVAQGSILDVPCYSFGSIGVFCIPEMERFYRYALLEHCFPHHGAVAFSRVGRILYDVFRYLGIEEIDYNRPAHERYPAENPFL